MCIYDIPRYIYRPDFIKKQFLMCENISTDYTIWKPLVPVTLTDVNDGAAKTDANKNDSKIIC